MVHAYRDYLDSLYQAARRHYDDGLVPFEMKPLVAEELNRFAGWTGFDDELGKHLSLATLEVEENLFK